MRSYHLTGDILHAGTVSAQGDTPRAAIEAAESGAFTVVDEQGKCPGFTFDGDSDHIQLIGPDGQYRPVELEPNGQATAAAGNAAALEDEVAQLIAEAQTRAIFDATDGEYGPDELFSGDDCVALARQILKRVAARVGA